MILLDKIQAGLRFVLPPVNWRFSVMILLGVISGLGIFIIYISKATSYLSEKPEVCMNCHIMAPQYNSWNHSAHREVATCNDCHVPQDNIVNHYRFKATDGLRHSWMFTFRLEPQVIKIHAAGKQVVNENCKRCHEKLISCTSLIGLNSETDRHCSECHRETPHGRIKGLSSVPNARVPTTGSIIPDWIHKILKKGKNNEKHK